MQIGEIPYHNLTIEDYARERARELANEFTGNWAEANWQAIYDSLFKAWMDGYRANENKTQVD